MDLVFDIDVLFLRLIEATNCLHEDDQNNVIQNMARYLREYDHVSLIDIRTSLAKIGFSLQEVCCVCNEPIGHSCANDDPVCSDCDTDADSCS